MITLLARAIPRTVKPELTEDEPTEHEAPDPKADNAHATGNPKAAEKPAIRPVATPARAPAAAVVKGENSETAAALDGKPSHSKYAKEPTRQATLCSWSACASLHICCLRCVSRVMSF